MLNLGQFLRCRERIWQMRTGSPQHWPAREWRVEPGVREPARGTKVECELKRSLDGRAERYASPQVADAQREDVESSNCLLADEYVHRQVSGGRTDVTREDMWRLRASLDATSGQAGV